MEGLEERYDITFIDIPCKKFPQEKSFAKKLNTLYTINNIIIKEKTGYTLEEKQYYYSSGILCLSTYLKEKNFKIGYVNYPKDELIMKEKVLASKYVGFSTMTITIDTVLELAKKIKDWNPQIQILLGGYHATYFAEELLQNNLYIDGIILQEGEIPLAQILGGVPLDDVKGVCYKRANGTININNEVHFLEENEIPVPDFTLLENDIEDYNIYIGTTRGCVGKCNFCVNHNYWGKIRFLSIEKVEKLFRDLDKMIKKPCMIHIIDNVFTINKERLRKISNIIQPYKEKFVFECDTLSSLIDKEKINLLENMNVIKIGLGFEDCVDEINKIANKSVTIADNINAAIQINKFSKKICVYAYWLIGLPGTSKESVSKNIKMMRKLISEEIVHVISPKIFIPYPGTIFQKRSSEFGLYIVSKKWNNYERISPPYPYFLEEFTEIQLENALDQVLNTCIEEYIAKWNLDIKLLESEKNNTWYENE